MNHRPLIPVLLAVVVAVIVWMWVSKWPSGTTVAKWEKAGTTLVQSSPSPDPEWVNETEEDQLGIGATEEVAAVLLSQPMDLSDPEKRAEVVAALRKLDRERDEAVARKARMLGIEVSGIRDDGTEFVLSGFEGDVPIYQVSENANAAISTTVDQVRNISPFDVDGGGETLGMWEVNRPRASHQEFGSPSRLVFGQGRSGTSDHATHVAGTLIAAGLYGPVQGMAPGAKILCYDSGSDTTEMLAVGAAVAGEEGRILISNHSYGLERGWDGNEWLGFFVDDDDPSNDYEDDFGRYSSLSATLDGLTYNLPYYLPFFSAGNHGNDAAPAAGETWRRGSSSYVFDPSIHPKGDDDYKNGFDQCEGKKIAKNVMAVGATSDAVLGGTRRLQSANKSGFSSSGPADDGRIKPDIVANGSSLLSLGAGSDSDTSVLSGTSMSSSNAAGSAALLVNYYGSRFPGQVMRAATLKGLIIHTADDLGNAGPDYRYGWGLMNTLAAAELIRDQADRGGGRLLEERIMSAEEPGEWQGTAPGGHPLRVTLCWADPAGKSRNGHENRSRALVNDLNLSIQGPDGTHLPYVMPHVGDWSLQSLDAVAITGVNTVDNVEQVYLPDAAGGNYTVTVSHAGSLANGLQDYSLIISGLDEWSLGDLEVVVGEAFQMTGPEGGPFEPSFRDFPLNNLGDGSLDWTASEDLEWLDLSDSSGTLPVGGGDSIRAEIKASALELVAGTYEGTITFSNVSEGESTGIPVQLQVRSRSGLPFFEDFEGELADYWEITGTAGGRTVRSSLNGPHRGSSHLQMDSATGVSARNELTLTIDLSGRENVELSFWAKEFSDELQVAPEAPFTDGADFDGVAISADGVNWYPVMDYPSSFGSYTEFIIDLDAMIELHGLSYGEQFRIRFNQYDNSSIVTDGIAIDDIRLVESGPPEIEMEDADGQVLIDGLGLIEMDSVPIGREGEPVPVTIRNTGFGILTGLEVSKDGSGALDFQIGPLGTTTLKPGEATDFTVTFAPRDRGLSTAVLLVASNDPDEGIFNIQLSGFGLHTLESWRQKYFQTTADAGDAADLADPNKDGIINLMAFAVGLDPLEQGLVPLSVKVDGNDLLVSYQRSRAAMAAGVNFEVEWSDTLGADWSRAEVLEAGLVDDGMIQQVEAVLPKGSGGNRFVRLQVTKP